MPDPSNNSFIPKRGPVARSKSNAPSRRVYVFTLISYVLLFATLLATAGMYLYLRQLDKQLDKEIIAFNNEINSFSEEKMQEVLVFDDRLQQAGTRLNHSISVTAIFKAIEAATIDTVLVESLSLERVADEKYVLTAAIKTDNFDSTIFQRGEYLRAQTIEQVVIEDVLASAVAEGEVSEGPVVTFSAVLDIPVSAVPYIPTQDSANAAPIQNQVQTIQNTIPAEPVTPAVVNEETI